ncbi:MAG: hypothetical protein OEL78_08275 [Hyphomicrobiales bacterium]|nr:hypothetical protein [Hyphomicrobiales bacterium]
MMNNALCNGRRSWMDERKGRMAHRIRALAEIRPQVYFSLVRLRRAGRDAGLAKETVTVEGLAHCS